MNPKPFKAPSSLQALSPVGARLCLDLRHKMAGYGLEAGNAPPLVVAFSGGADSTALVCMLHCLGFSLVLAHLDHQLRPESTAEAEHALNVSKILGHPCQVRTVDVAALACQRNTGLEDAGRLARYAFFEDVRRQYQAPWIVTGHHRDDLCEDMLLRLLRGAGWPALAGMDEVQPQRHLLRPLLGCGRAQLVQWLHEADITWLEDASNNGDAYKRNRMRHHVMPLLLAENPGFPRAVHDLWRLAREDEEYWNQIITPVLEAVMPLTDEPVQAGKSNTHPQHGNAFSTPPDPPQTQGFFLPHAALHPLPRALRLRVYLRLIQKLDHGQARCNTLFQLDDAWTRRASGKQFKLPGGVCVRLCHAGLRFERQTKPSRAPA